MPSKDRPLEGEVLLDDRQAQRRRRFRWGRLVAALAIMGIVAGLIGLYFSPLLRVQNVEVTGTKIVSTDKVLALAALEDDSMLRVSTGEIARRIEELPMVRTTKVERDWPQTVRIHVTERGAWGYWESGEDVYVIDSEGYVLSGVEPDERAITIHAIDPAPPLAPGDRVDGDAVFLAQVILQRAPKTVSASVTAIEFSTQLGLAVETTAGYEVVIGDSQNFNHKLAVWEALEDEIGMEGMSGHVLDLRFGDRPSLQPIETGGDET